MHSVAAAKVQLKLLESAIFKAQQELEAGCGGQGQGWMVMIIDVENHGIDVN